MYTFSAFPAVINWVSYIIMKNVTAKEGRKSMTKLLVSYNESMKIWHEANGRWKISQLKLEICSDKFTLWKSEEQPAYDVKRELWARKARIMNVETTHLKFENMSHFHLVMAFVIQDKLLHKLFDTFLPLHFEHFEGVLDSCIHRAVDWNELDVRKKA